MLPAGKRLQVGFGHTISTRATVRKTRKAGCYGAVVGSSYLFASYESCLIRRRKQVTGPSTRSMKTKTALKWTIGVIALVILIALGALVSLFVAFFVSMERGEKHQRQIRAEQDSGRWDFGDQPALFAVAQGIVKNDPDAIRAAARASRIYRHLDGTGRRCSTSLSCNHGNVRSQSRRLELCFRSVRIRTTGKVAGTLSPWLTPCMRRR